ncbi:MAG: YraN family protein [Bacteroidales bacterium]
MAEHNETGKKAEKIAIAYLRGNGYTIKDTNWRYYKKEIDIVAEKDGKLIIVEVKSRYERYFGDVSELITRKKMKNLVDAAEAYVIKKDLMMEVQFDYFVVIFGSYGEKTHHIQEAFIPGVNW